MIWSKPSSLLLLPRNIDRLWQPLLAGMAVLCAVLLLLIVAFLLKEAIPALHDGGWRSFFNDQSWYPLENMFGLLPMLWASLAIVSLALLLAAPLGLANALFVRFYAPSFLVTPYRLMLALLAGMPSVVYGLWGLTVIVPIIAAYHQPGTSVLAASLVLALMILPTVALTCLAALEAVPSSLHAGAAALGMSKQGLLLGVIVPAARYGIGAGMVLATARALGETMVVLMVAGNVVQTPHSIFDPVRALTANIALEMGYATDLHRAGLFTSGLILTLLVLVLAWFAARTMHKYQYA
ncbi:MAG: phosphate ABC transporter permease subunit PstC [Mariprofundaceae bacterium]|nr:phosphate ABC transporter permease subunit PstC [Mariprofundaceae bacterium]